MRIHLRWRSLDSVLKEIMKISRKFTDEKTPFCNLMNVVEKDEGIHSFSPHELRDVSGLESS